MKFVLYLLTLLTLNIYVYGESLEDFNADSSNSLGKTDRLQKLEKQVQALTREVKASANDSERNLQDSKLIKQLDQMAKKIDGFNQNDINSLKSTVSSMEAKVDSLGRSLSKTRDVEIPDLKDDILKLSGEVKKLEEKLEAFAKKIE